MKTPELSVVLDGLSQEASLPASIESVLAHTLSAFEFIILNDGSTDRTWEIIQEYAKKDSRIRPFSFPEKQGIAVGCNFTVAQAKGDYLARIDGDDIWKPEKLEKQVAYLEEHPECGVCFTQVEIIDGQGKIVHGAECDFMDELFAQPNRSQSQWLRKLFIDGNCFVHSSSVIRKNCFDAIDGYRNALRQLPDFDLWMQLIQVSNFYVIQEKWMWYRWHSQNTSVRNSVGACRTYQEYFQLYLNVFQSIPSTLFCDAFSSMFRCGDSSSPQELECEQAFLLLDHSAGELQEAGKLAGMTILTSLLNKESSRKLLEKKYNFTTFDYVELESSPLFYSTPLFYPDSKLTTNIFSATATLYYNTEMELNAEKTLTADYHSANGLAHFTFKLPEENIQILRFDPLENHPCTVWYFHAQLNGQTLKCEPVNSQFIGGWSFSCGDPQIMLQLPEPACGTITITLGVSPFHTPLSTPEEENQVSVSRNEFLQIQQNLTNQFQQKEITLQTKIQQISDQLQAITADRDALRAQLDRIYQTPAYRAYAKVKHIIKK